MYYYNTETDEYPRYQGDLELLGWVFGTPLPEGWVEVNDTEQPVPSSTEIVEIGHPVETSAGSWEMAWVVRELTAEELLERRLYGIRDRVFKRELITQEEADLLVG